MFRRPLSHVLRRLEPCGLPDAISHGAEAQQILAAIRLKQLPAVAGPLLTTAHGLDLEMSFQERP